MRTRHQLCWIWRRYASSAAALERLMWASRLLDECITGEVLGQHPVTNLVAGQNGGKGGAQVAALAEMPGATQSMTFKNFFAEFVTASTRTVRRENWRRVFVLAWLAR